MSWADLVTSLRAAAILPIAFLFPEHPWLCFFTFIAAALTDALDGWVAKKFGQKSALGAWLDPLADKVLYLGSLYVIIFTPASSYFLVLLVRLPLAFVVFITAAMLESFLVVIRLWVKPQATLAGKLKTLVQFGSCALLFWGYAAPDLFLIDLGMIGMFLALPLAAASLLSHALKFKKTA